MSFILSLLYLLFYLFLITKYILLLLGSMEPTLKINELIVVENSKENSNYEIGDIITFYDEEMGADVTHRIIKITENGYYTKGDFNNVEDLNIVTKDRIVGRLVFNSYLLGYAILNYRYVLLTLIMLLIIVFNVIFSKKDVKEGLKDEENT